MFHRQFGSIAEGQRFVKMHWPDSFEQLGVRVTAAGRSVRVELTRGPQKRTAPG